MTKVESACPKNSGPGSASLALLAIPRLPLRTRGAGLVHTASGTFPWLSTRTMLAWPTLAAVLQTSADSVQIDLTGGPYSVFRQ